MEFKHLFFQNIAERVPFGWIWHVLGAEMHPNSTYWRGDREADGLREGEREGRMVLEVKSRFSPTEAPIEDLVRTKKTFLVVKISNHSSMEEFDKIDIYGNEIAKAFRDSLISMVPVAVRLLEAHEKANLQIKINFFEEIISELKGVDKNEINWSHLGSNDFLVMFNSVLERVRYTTAEEKKKRFKEILIKDLKTTYKSDFKETFLDLILSLNSAKI